MTSFIKKGTEHEFQTKVNSPSRSAAAMDGHGTLRRELVGVGDEAGGGDIDRSGDGAPLRIRRERVDGSRSRGRRSFRQLPGISTLAECAASFSDGFDSGFEIGYDLELAESRSVLGRPNRVGWLS